MDTFDIGLALSYPEELLHDWEPEPETVSATVVAVSDVWFAEVKLSSGQTVSMGGITKIDAMKNLKNHLENVYPYVTLDRHFVVKTTENQR
jgi:hypothetical protein